MPSCAASTVFVCPGDEVSVNDLFSPTNGGALTISSIESGVFQPCGTSFQTVVSGVTWSASQQVVFVPANAVPNAGGVSDPITICARENNGTPFQCQFSFIVNDPASAACSGGNNGGNCLDAGTQTTTVNGTVTVQPGALNSSGQPPTSFIESANGITQVGGLSPISITGLANGTNTIAFTFPNGDECDLVVVVSNGGGGGNGDVTGQVFGDNACNGTVRVCLQNSDGSPYFGNFDICGGIASGVGGTTGAQNGDTSQCQLSNFQTINSAQCFDLGYTPESNSATSDTIVIQPTDANGGSVGDAISVPFTFAACDGTGGNELACEVSSMVVTSPGTVTGAQLAMGGTPGYQVTALTNPPAGFTISNGAVSIAAGVANGTYSTFVTVIDSDGGNVFCPIDFIIGGGTGCIDTTASTVGIVQQGPFSPGDELEFVVTLFQEDGTPGLQNHFMQIKDSAGNVVGQPDFDDAAGGSAFWSYNVPANCANGIYSVCVLAPAGSGCPEWDVGTVTFTGCTNDPDPGGGGCSTGIIAGGLVTSPVEPAPGQIVTVTRSGNNCNCPGCEFKLTPDPLNPFNDNVISTMSNGGMSVGGVVTYRHPSGMGIGQEIVFLSECCCPDEG